MAISQLLFPRHVQSDSTFKQRLQTVLLQHQFAKNEDVSIAQLDTSAVEERQRLFYAQQEPSLTGMQRWERSRVSAFNQMLHVHQDFFPLPCHVFTIFKTGIKLDRLPFLDSFTSLLVSFLSKRLIPGTVNLILLYSRTSLQEALCQNLNARFSTLQITTTPAAF